MDNDDCRDLALSHQLATQVLIATQEALVLLCGCLSKTQPETAAAMQKALKERAEDMDDQVGAMFILLHRRLDAALQGLQVEPLLMSQEPPSKGRPVLQLVPPPSEPTS